MLSNSLTLAKEFDKKPILLAVGEREKLYYVKESDLPAMSKTDSPLGLVSERELFKLKKKYNVTSKVFKKIENVINHNIRNLISHIVIRLKIA